MNTPILTIILVDVFELDTSYLSLFLEALREWNSTGLEDTEIILISQKRSATEAHAICAKHSTPIDVVHARQDWVDGYPIWDNVTAVRNVWPMVRGRYVTFSHPEFIWGPDRLQLTIDWLKKERPYLALGNLRRTGTNKDVVEQKTQDHCNKELSEALRWFMTEGKWEDAAGYFESIKNSWWTFWTPEPKPGVTPYSEDVFFADKDWLDAWQFIWHGKDYPFQDVYDLMGTSVLSVLQKNMLSPIVTRIPMPINKLMHLWHSKEWQSWTEPVRDYFFSNQIRWQGTKFLDPVIWERLLQVRTNMPKNGQPVGNLRNAPGGTVTRYGMALSQWLRTGGVNALGDFYIAHGRERREV